MPQGRKRIAATVAQLTQITLGRGRRCDAFFG
jgi:hypothetical protein